MPFRWLANLRRKTLAFPKTKLPGEADGTNLVPHDLRLLLPQRKSPTRRKTRPPTRVARATICKTWPTELCYNSNPRRPDGKLFHLQFFVVATLPPDSSGSKSPHFRAILVTFEGNLFKWNSVVSGPHMAPFRFKLNQLFGYLKLIATHLRWLCAAARVELQLAN